VYRPIYGSYGIWEQVEKQWEEAAAIEAEKEKERRRDLLA
jgi:hypothetical protein